MPKKATKSNHAKATAKKKEPQSKSLYHLSAADLPHYTGTLSFDGSNSERASAIQKQFPGYDCADPRTFVAIPYAAIRASLGSDYKGHEKFPPYVAYPTKVAQSFSKYALSSMGLGNRGTLHRLYPLNFDQKGRLRDKIGMTKAELTEFLCRFADGTKKQPKQANKKARGRNLKAWLMMERDEEKREGEMARAELQLLSAEAEDARRRRDAEDTAETKETSDESGDEEDDSSTVDSEESNNRKRRTDDDGVSETNDRAAKKAKVRLNLE